MKTRFLTMILMALLVVAGEATAQSMSHSVSGVVRDAQTGKRLGQASVTADEGHDATVTNSDGYFVLKTQEPAKVLRISCLGYETVEGRAGQGTENQVEARRHHAQRGAGGCDGPEGSGAGGDEQDSRQLQSQ